MKTFLDKNAISDWIRGWLRGGPHFIVGAKDNPYLLRWFVLPRNALFNIYLHKFMRDDDDRALHDHPWASMSIIIKGGYIEVLSTSAETRWPGNVVTRQAIDAHRIQLLRDHARKVIPCWTIFLTGKVVREWGFYCPKRWVPSYEYLKARNPGEPSRGCGEQ